MTEPARKVADSERKGRGAHPQARLGRAALRFARVPQKLAQGRLGPPNCRELGTVRPSQAPLCGPVPGKRKGCGAHHQTDQELFRAALRLARVPQKLAQGWLGPPNCRELGIVRPSQAPLCGCVPQGRHRAGADLAIAKNSLRSGRDRLRCARPSSWRASGVRKRSF